MKKFFIALATLLMINFSFAQSKTLHSTSYKTALGVKVWDGGGITLKHFLSGDKAGELIGYFWNRGFRLTGLYEIHGNVAGAEGLKWYVGPGAHLGFYDYFKDNNHIDGTYIGIDGVLGLDFKFKNAPINLSLDWQPSFEFGNYLGFAGNWGGLAIRYTF